MFSKKVHIGLFLVGILLLSACSSKFMKLQKNGTTEDKYKAAMEYYKKADYYRSGLLFEEIIPLLKGVDSTAEYAQFYNAYCQYYQRQYQMSSYLFKTFYSTYANSPLADEAFYMSAYSMYKDAPNYNLDQTSTLTAIDALQTYINTFPESKYAEECNKDLKDLRHRLEQKAYEKAKLYYKTRTVTIMNLKAAVVTIQNFERDFPDSEFIEELAYLKVQAQYELAQVSFEDKQKERYGDVLKFYEKFVDVFPKSKYLKQAEKSYDGANKALEKIAKAELEA
ncbi:MAG: outer membrane protein assembly factor BamD, partial [Spirosomaceae bacterium]|nr:outer membrane protein assembly factor BamD [Spirosomataceae bacterium]